MGVRFIAYTKNPNNNFLRLVSNDHSPLSLSISLSPSHHDVSEFQHLL